MGVEDDILEDIILESVHVTVRSHINRLCSNVTRLDDVSLCSFVTCKSDETNIQIMIKNVTRTFQVLASVIIYKDNLGPIWRRVWYC